MLINATSFTGLITIAVAYGHGCHRRGMICPCNSGSRWHTAYSDAPRWLVTPTRRLDDMASLLPSQRSPRNSSRFLILQPQREQAKFRHSSTHIFLQIFFSQANNSAIASENTLTSLEVVSTIHATSAVYQRRAAFSARSLRCSTIVYTALFACGDHGSHTECHPSTLESCYLKRRSWSTRLDRYVSNVSRHVTISHHQSSDSVALEESLGMG